MRWLFHPRLLTTLIGGTLLLQGVSCTEAASGVTAVAATVTAAASLFIVTRILS
jgi:hypothetical protein